MIIPYLDMVCRVEIGSVVINDVSGFRIEESVTQMGNNATIVLARQFQKLKGKSLLEYIKAGDQVKIYAGYDQNIEQEFAGYLLPPQDEMPLVLRCDDQFYPLKQNNWVESFRSISLKALLQKIVTGYKVDCPDLELGRYHINNASTYRVLQAIKEDYGLFSRIIGDTLHVGLAYDWNIQNTKKHILHHQKNVKSTNLTWKTETDFKVRVEVNIGKVRGKRHVVKFGSSETHCSVKTLHYEGITEGEAMKIAQANYRKIVYNGFTGSITSFGIPRTHAGDSLHYKNDLQPEKEGTYLIDKLSIDYNEGNGYSRENHLAYKIS